MKAITNLFSRRKPSVFIFIFTGLLLFSNCTRNGPATEQSPQMGAANAEGGTTPNVSHTQDSLARNRAGGAEQNAGVSQPLKPNTTATPED